MSKKVVIVGQGITGTCLAHTLIAKGCEVVLIDNNAKQTASKIATGVYNPVALKRLIKSWKAEVFFPFAKNFYSNVEEQLGVSFYHQLPIIKIFDSIAEQNDWLAKSSTKLLGQYFSSDLVEVSVPYKAPFGAGEVQQCGWMDVLPFLEASKQCFAEKGNFIKEDFDYNELQFLDEGVQYKNISADHIVFCEGEKVQQNPLFSWLPFAPNKGEVLTIKSDELTTNKIYNKQCFVLPQSKNEFKLGSTFNWSDLKNNPTKEGKKELTDKLDAIADANYVIGEQQSAIRLAVRDRKPVIGLHPNFPQVSILNGMGSKGVVLAPYCSELLVNQLLNDEVIEKELNIERFNKHL